MNTRILSALKALRVDEMSRAEWIAVGMALKEEGFPLSVWDDWSRNDSRYHPGECERQWESFRGAEKPVTGGTILQMALGRGWNQWGEDGCLAWDDTIYFDGDDAFTGFDDPDAWLPTEDLIRYLEVLFRPEDIVVGEAVVDQSGIRKQGI